MILKKVRWFQLFVPSQNSNFRTFKKIQIFGFPWCSTSENLSIDVSITIVGLILTKIIYKVISALRHKLKFEFWTYLKTNMGFHGVVLVKTFPLMYQLLIYDWYWRSYEDFFFRGTDKQTDGQTARHAFGILTWKHVVTQKILAQSSKLVVGCRFLYAYMSTPIWTGMHKNPSGHVGTRTCFAGFSQQTCNPQKKDAQDQS